MDPYDRSTLVHIQQSASFTKSQRRNGSKMWMDDSRSSIGGVCIFCFCLFFRKIFFTIYTFFCAATFFLAFSMKFGGDFSVFVSHVNIIINQNKTKTYHKEISQKKYYIHIHMYSGLHWYSRVCVCVWQTVDSAKRYFITFRKKIVLQKIFLKLQRQYNVSRCSYLRIYIIIIAIYLMFIHESFVRHSRFSVHPKRTNRLFQRPANN